MWTASPEKAFTPRGDSRFCLFDLFFSRWFFPGFLKRNFPLLVTLIRFFSPLWVLSFGIVIKWDLKSLLGYFRSSLVIVRLRQCPSACRRIVSFCCAPGPCGRIPFRAARASPLQDSFRRGIRALALPWFPDRVNRFLNSDVLL